MNLQHTWRDHKVLILGWLFLLWAALSSGITFISAEADQKPDRLLWLTYILTGLHLIAIFIITILPLTTRFQWKSLKALIPILRQPWVYSVLLILFALAELYAEPYFWLVPLLTLIARILLVAIACYLYDQRERFLFQRMVMAILWWLYLLIVHQIFKTAASSSLILPLLWLKDGRDALVWGSLQLGLLFAPLIWLIPGVQRWLDQIYSGIIRLPFAFIGAVWAITILSLLGYQMSREGQFDLLFLLPMGLLCLSLAVIGATTIRYREPLLGLLKAQTSTVADTLQFALYLILCSIPCVIYIYKTKLLWEYKVNADMWISYHGILLYIVDRPLALLMIGLVFALLIDVQFRTQFFDTTRRIIRQHGGIWWVAFVGWMFISVLWAESAVLALYTSVYLTVELITAFALANFISRKWRWGLLVSVCASAVVQSILAVAQIINEGSLGLGWLGEIQRDPQNPFNAGLEPFRGSGLGGHPNLMSGFLIIGLFCALLLMGFRDKNGYAFKVGLAAVVIIVIGILATASRAALLATLFASIPLTLYFAPRFKDYLQFSNRRLILGSVLIFAVGVVGIFSLSGDSLDRLFSLFDNPTRHVQRFKYALDDTVAVVTDSPIVGSGAGNLLLHAEQLRPDTPAPFVPAHNVFLLAWAEVGLPGLFLFVLACATILAYSRPRYGTEVFIIGCCFAALCFIMFLDVYLRNSPSRLMVFWVLGLWWGYRLQPDDPPTAESATST